MTPDVSRSPNSNLENVNKAFSKQSAAFDELDLSNQILQDMRQQVYGHVRKFMKPESKILELNAGTGIDAVHFINEGHTVHATDLSDGMIRELRSKALLAEIQSRLTVQQVSFESLNEIGNTKFDYVFSNFGGLNCIPDLKQVTRHLPRLLKPGGYVTWVIMPTVCLWEIVGVAKGNFRQSLRRFSRHGAVSHLEGEYFRTYYHSLRDIRHAFPDSFKLEHVEGLGSLSPQPHHARLVADNPRIYHILRKLDAKVRHVFPFNRWADHIIVTFTYQG